MGPGARGATAGIVLVLAMMGPAVGQSRDAVVRQPVVRTLSIEGNKAIDDRTIRVSVATSQASALYRWRLTHWLGLGSAPRFNDKEFRRDVLRIKAMYGVAGFPNAIVDTIVRRNDLDHSITVLIDEGRPILVDTLEITGFPDSLLSRDDIDRVLLLRQGEPFDRISYDAAPDQLKVLLGNQGYAFARVASSFALSPDSQSVQVHLAARPGPIAVIDRVIVEGTENINPRVILKAISIRPGDVYSVAALEQSELDLFEMDLFRQASVRVEDSIPASSRDSTITVRVVARVAESPLQRARLSAGYGTLSCFRNLGALDLFNFSGGGRRLELRAASSMIGVGAPFDGGFERSICPSLRNEDPARLKLNYNLSATLHEPLLFTRRATGTLSIFGERHTEVGAFLRETVGGEAAATRTLALKMPLRLSYRMSWGRTLADPATFCAFLNVCRLSDTDLFLERRRQSVVGLQLVWDKTNSAMDPSEGTAISTELRFAPAVLGADPLTRFAKFGAEFESHHPIGLSGTLSWRLEAGTLFSPQVSLPGGDVTFAPPEERYYAGGANSVRGFNQSLLGPVVRVLDTVEVNDAGEVDSIIRTSPIGGATLMLAGVEARFPLPLFAGKLSGAVFVDAGQILPRRELRFNEIRITPGVGFRLASLLGPIRFDIAYNGYDAAVSPLFRREGGELVPAIEQYQPRLTVWNRLQLHFSIGQPF